MRSPLLPDLQIKTTSTLSTETCIQFRLQSTLFILHLLSWNMKRWFLKGLQEVLLRVKHISSMRQLKGTEVNGSNTKAPNMSQLLTSSQTTARGLSANVFALKYFPGQLTVVQTVCGWALPAVRALLRKCTVKDPQSGRTVCCHACESRTKPLLCIFPDHVVKLSILHWRDVDSAIPLQH